RGALVSGAFRDVTALRAAEAEREAARTVDVTTGLSNGVRLERHLQAACAEQGGVLVTLGLDRFKLVNEILGRAAGDRMLRAIGLALEQAAPLGSAIARLASDELAVLLPGTHNGLEILRVVSALEAAVESASLAHGMLVTSSLGVSVAPDDATEPDAWLHCAEIALRTAKRGGGNRVEYFAPALRTRIEAKTLLLQDVRRGLAADEFELHYQPICGVNGIARGFEGLMRWNHPDRGLLAPYHFMIAFDDPELAIGLGRKALEQSLAQMRSWGHAGLQYGYVALNLSSAQLAQETLAEEVGALLREYELEPHRLMLEVTESVYLDEGKERIARCLNDLRQIGVSFALDDFGTGYASLTHLKEFAIDRIKVDQTFVREIAQNAESRAIIRAVLWLGKALGMQVVAEGVETAEQLEFLMDVGCELVQGYYFARPMPARDAGAFCRQAPGQ
ncbi:MAG: bifunctional diguanylate cyclase/phosphodiesterase, partial [Proteobacteria bacterium]